MRNDDSDHLFANHHVDDVVPLVINHVTIMTTLDYKIDAREEWLKREGKLVRQHDWQLFGRSQTRSPKKGEPILFGYSKLSNVFAASPQCVVRTKDLVENMTFPMAELASQHYSMFQLRHLVEL
jgi:hypothetical protein